MAEIGDDLLNNGGSENLENGEETELPNPDPLSSGTEGEEELIATILAAAPGGARWSNSGSTTTGTILAAAPGGARGSNSGSTTALMGSLKLEDDETDTKDLFITVDDPQKHTFKVDSYVTYRVFTRTTRGNYDNSEYSVRRRYQDFLWLRQKLADSQPTHLVPPLPEKHSMRMDRFSTEFLGVRQRALNQFLDRISEHPVLSFNESFKVFLTAKAWELAAHRKQGSNIMSRVGSSLKTTSSTYLLKNRDPEFTIMQEYIQTFGDKLGSIERITGRILTEEREYAAELDTYGPVFRLWANSEGELNDDLLSIAEAVERVSKGTKKSADTLDVDSIPTLKEYNLYAEAVKAVLKRRDYFQLEHELAADELSRKKNEREHIKISDQAYSFGAFIGKDPQDVKEEKSTRVESQIEKLQRQVEFLSDKAECANADLKADMDRWHKHKRKDVKQLLVDLAEQQTKKYEEHLGAWEAVIAHLRNGGGDDSNLALSNLVPGILSQQELDVTFETNSATDTKTSGSGDAGILETNNLDIEAELERELEKIE